MNQTAVAIIVVAVVVFLVIVGIALVRRTKQRRSERLRTRFGPEYDRVLNERGDRTKAEKALEEREKRSRKIVIRPLSPEERDRFANSWREIQSRFVDAPGEAVLEADKLLEQLMSTRGYPVGSFEQQAEDISVDHPAVVQDYRRAHELAERRRQDKAGTEDLRNALIHYRTLYAELLGTQTLVAHEVSK